MKGIAAVLILYLAPLLPRAQQLYDIPRDVDSRWVGFENPTGEKGKGGMENKGAKGNASQWIKAGTSRVLADLHDAGVINRIWMTIIDRNPKALRSIVLEIYWDGAKKPAGSGTEDYIGSAWNLGAFNNLYQNCKVTIQQMGGAGRDLIRGIAKAGGRVKPVSELPALAPLGERLKGL